VATTCSTSGIRIATTRLAELRTKSREVFFPADPPQFQSVPFSYRFEPTKESLIEVGFTDINAAVLRLEKEIPDLAILARGLVYGNPIIDQVLARGGVEPEQIVDAIVQEYRREFGTDPGRMHLQAIVFSAKKAVLTLSGGVPV
jgi:hypothetical protein